jgi:transcriptional regulator with XRE-family HTH domain
MSSDLAKAILARIRSDAGLEVGASSLELPPDSVKRRRSASSRPLSISASRALKQLGRGIVIARKARRLTQAELAQRAGIARKTVVSLESGAGSPSLSSFVEVLACLDDDMLDALVDFVLADPTGKRLMEARLPQAIRRNRRSQPIPPR